MDATLQQVEEWLAKVGDVIRKAPPGVSAVPIAAGCRQVLAQYHADARAEAERRGDGPDPARPARI